MLVAVVGIYISLCCYAWSEWMVFLTRYNFAGNVMEQFIAFHCKLLLIPAQL